jgi:sterol desaturase/sphingolipid hydroxylase (fatty acid hydroxylase superfamily)
MSPFARLILMNFLVLVPGGYVFFEWTPLPVPQPVHTLLVLVVGFAMTTLHSVAYRRAVHRPADEG